MSVYGDLGVSAVTRTYDPLKDARAELSRIRH